MLAALAATLLISCSREPAQSDVIAQIDNLAKARNADGLMSHAGPDVKALCKPFFFLRTNGPYDTGRHGWTAHPLKSPSGKQYVVFSTKITSEDYGEFLFAFDGQKLTKYVPETEPGPYRIMHQKMDIQFDLPQKKAMLHSKVDMRRTGSGGGELFLRLSPHYKVSKLHEAGIGALKWVQAGGIVAVHAPNKASFSLDMTYAGVVNLPQYAGSITNREALLTNDYWYPMIGRLPATYEATIHCPPGWTGVAQGELVSDVNKASERVMTWRMDMPVTYWSLSAAAYKSETTEHRGKKYTVWSLTMSPDQMRLQGELSAPVIEFYESAFGKYPFSFWGAVDSPQYGGGALEAYSFATYGTGWLPDEDTHEPAHTWWGGLINNTYLNSLWNESFANFSGGLYNREGPIGNKDEKRQAFVSDADPAGGYAAAPMSRSGVFIGPPSSSIGYGRGADVLQMLELELGTEKMVAAMRHWLQTHPKGEPGEWEHFEKAVKASSGMDMTRFFDEWLRRPGFVDFDVTNVRWENGRVLGEVSFKSEPYHLLTEVMLQFPGGRREFVKIRLEPGAGKRGVLSVLSADKPELVSIDPWRRILRPKNANERPVELGTLLQRARRYQDPGARGWMSRVRSGAALDALPSNLDGVFLVASPETNPIMRGLCERAGFSVRGDRLEYAGSVIDLTTQGALAVVDLPSGGHCVIGLGNSRRPPSLGRSRLALFDHLGRFLRGKTDPKTSGNLTFRL